MDGLPFEVPVPTLAAFTLLSRSSRASARRSCRPAAPRGSTCWRRCTTSRRPAAGAPFAEGRPAGAFSSHMGRERAGAAQPGDEAATATGAARAQPQGQHGRGGDELQAEHDRRERQQRQRARR